MKPADADAGDASRPYIHGHNQRCPIHARYIMDSGCDFSDGSEQGTSLENLLKGIRTDTITTYCSFNTNTVYIRIELDNQKFGHINSLVES